MRYFFRVEYDGTDFGGWQTQPNTPSIQEQLEKALQIVLRRDVAVTGAGRTDAGVHGLGQAAHFDHDGPLDTGKLELSLNAILPREIAVYNLAGVNESFHARFSAFRRRYKYYMCVRKKPLLYKRVWMVFGHVDWNLVKENMNALLGTHDFKTFCASGATSDNTVCSVKNVSLDNVDECIVFTIEADRFIYRMVRSVLGTLIDIGRGRIKAPMSEIIESCDRSFAGTTAPACGLVLDKVFYPAELIDESL